MSTSNNGYYEVFSPRGARQSKLKPLAKRVGTLDHKTVAFLWDYVFRGDEVFDLLEEGLKARFPGVRCISWREFGNVHGLPVRTPGQGIIADEIIPSLPKRFKELGVDAVICGMAC